MDVEDDWVVIGLGGMAHRPEEFDLKPTHLLFETTIEAIICWDDVCSFLPGDWISKSKIFWDWDWPFLEWHDGRIHESTSSYTSKSLRVSRTEAAGFSSVILTCGFVAAAGCQSSDPNLAKSFEATDRCTWRGFPSEVGLQTSWYSDVLWILLKHLWNYKTSIHDTFLNDPPSKKLWWFNAKQL